MLSCCQPDIDSQGPGKKEDRNRTLIPKSEEREETKEQASLDKPEARSSGAQANKNRSTRKSLSGSRLIEALESPYGQAHLDRIEWISVSSHEPP